MAPWKTVVAGSLSALMACSAAQASGYIAVDGSSIAVENALDDDLNPRGLRLRLGMRLGHMMDLELHIGSASDDKTEAFEDFSTVFAGAFLKGYLPVGHRSALFALVGASSLEHTQKVNGREFSDSQSGFSYGFGLETQLTQSLDLSADYMRYTNEDTPFSEVSAVSLGFKWYF